MFFFRQLLSISSLIFKLPSRRRYTLFYTLAGSMVILNAIDTP